jgi:hypothetical protein
MEGLRRPPLSNADRGTLCEWGCLSSWLNPAADDVNIRWARELAGLMRPFTTGSGYVNQIGLETHKGSERIKSRLLGGLRAARGHEGTCSSEFDPKPSFDGANYCLTAETGRDGCASFPLF